MALSDAPLSLPLGRIVQLPLLCELQREARQPNARGRLSLTKTPMTEVTRALVPPLGFRITGRLPHHQLLNVKQNPPFHQNRPGVVPCRKSKKKKKPPTSPQTGGGTPPSGAKKEENSFKKKNQKRKKKRIFSQYYFSCQNRLLKNPVGAPPLPGKNEESEVTI